jgi:uncharacterized C2H2 Zn-finger protein
MGTNLIVGVFPQKSLESQTRSSYKSQMFIIAGVTPKIVALDKNPRRCPACGLVQAYLKRADSYLSLFFIPLFRVKKGELFVQCNRCEYIESEGSKPFQSWQEKRQSSLCQTCGRSLNGDFKYCPNCGSKV